MSFIVVAFDFVTQAIFLLNLILDFVHLPNDLCASKRILSPTKGKEKAEWREKKNHHQHFVIVEIVEIRQLYDPYCFQQRKIDRWTHKHTHNF